MYKKERFSLLALEKNNYFAMTSFKLVCASTFYLNQLTKIFKKLMKSYEAIPNTVFDMENRKIGRLLYWHFLSLKVISFGPFLSFSRFFCLNN